MRNKSKIFWGLLPNPNFKVFFIAIFIIKQASWLIFCLQLDFNLTRRNMEKKLKIFSGRLPNPKSNVFFMAISITKKARRLIFSKQLYFNIIRRNIERKYSNYFEVVYQFPIVRSSFKAISRIKQARKLNLVCNLF